MALPNVNPPQGRAARFAVVGLGLLFLLWIGYLLGPVLNPMLIAILLAYYLNPLVEWMNVRGIPRFRAVLLIYAAGLLAAAGLLFFFAPRVLRQTSRVAKDLSGLLEKVSAQKPPGAPSGEKTSAPAETDPLADLRKRIQEKPFYQRARALLEVFRDEPQTVKEFLGKASAVGAWLGERLTSTLKEAFALLSYLFLVPLYTLYLLQKIPVLQSRLQELIPPQHKDQALRLAHQVDLAMAGFFFGRTLVCLGKGALVFVGLWVLGVPYALLIGLGVAVLSLLPALSLIAGGGLALLLAYMDGAGTATMIGIAVLFVASEVADGIAGPIILGKTASLHPIMIVFALLAFGKLFGLFGVLMAVPLACATKILWTQVAVPYWQATWGPANGSNGLR